MKKSGLIWGVVLVAVGVIGLAATYALSGRSAAGGVYTSIGQQIYDTGTDARGPIPRSVAGGGTMGFGMMGASACVDCHGRDGRGGRVGGMFGAVEVPDIRYSILTTPRTEGTETIPAWTDADIARAIRQGVDPDGVPIKAPMPRWSMTDADVSDVIAYLKELNPR
jgi:cytochrome c oxidase subunit 2